MARLCLFGHPVLSHTASNDPLGLSSKAIALLTVLAANAERAAAREWLAEMLWPDAGPEEARTNLRRHLYVISKALGESMLVVKRQTVQWNAQAPYECDVVLFDRLRSEDPDRAAALYAGDLCTGLADPALDELRRRYRSRYEYLLRSQREASRLACDDEALRRCLHRLIAFDPLDEEAVAELMAARARSGDRAGALRDFAALRQRLRSEIGVEPGARTTALFTEIATGDNALSVGTNLPDATTTFVGRERELSEIVDALHDGGAMAIVGPAGVGKSRLAIRAATDTLQAFPDGLWLVELDRARDRADIWERIAEAMQIPMTEHPDAAVLAALDSRRTMLVLDTCERVSTCVPSVIEQLCAQGTSVLATSRKRLHHAGIRELTLEGLEIPPATLAADDTALRYSAYRLFVERAALVNPSFRAKPDEIHVVRDLLRSLDGLPLAIELVASRSNILSVADLRRRLGHALRRTETGQTMHRNRTLDATLRWSYDMLGATEQFVFAAVGMFLGTFTLEDVEAVCGGTPDATAALVSLVDASLAVVTSLDGDARYRLLETTRTFARERLAEHPARDGVERRYVERIADSASTLVSAPESRYGDLLPRVLSVMPDYLAALQLCTARAWGALGVCILDGIYRFGMRHHSTAAIRTAGRALAESRLITEAERARAARLTAIVCGNVEAIELFARAVEYYRNASDTKALADALNGLAASYYKLGDRDRCERCLLEARALLEGQDDRRLLLKTMVRLGTLYSDYARSRAVLEPAIEPLLELGEVRQAAQQLKNLAARAFLNGSYEDAIAWSDRALELVSATADQGLLMNLHSLRGCAYARIGNAPASLRAHLQANDVAMDVGECPESVECVEDAAMTLSVLGAYDEAARAFGYAHRGRRTVDSPLHDAERSSYDEALATLRSSLGSRFEPLFWSGAEDDYETAMARMNAALANASGASFGC